MRTAPAGACEFLIRGTVQGVGFRPHVYRLAERYGLAGWVENGERGVAIHVEGARDMLDAFARALVDEAPPAASIADVSVAVAPVAGFAAFAIRESHSDGTPTVRVSPDLPVCDACLRELFDPNDRRCGYPYINCTDCGPRYSIILGLPYDRQRTTMAEWPPCEACAREYHDPRDRRFHAQPVACHACGPTVFLRAEASPGDAPLRGAAAIAATARLLRAGAIVAIKGIGGYHLACDARNASAVAALRERKFRKERPFAVMVRDAAAARTLVALDASGDALLQSMPRPIVLAEARASLEGIAPDNRELGVMVPYTPVHHLLFAAGAPDVLVMTSANRSSEPIAYEDDDALASLAGIADAFLVGERRIARRVDDSVARATPFGTTVLRRARGMSPQAVATIPSGETILALGGDLKSAVALVVDGQVFVSQHVGDLEHYPARVAFERTVADLCAMYEVAPQTLRVVHDAHPGYVSTGYARERYESAAAVQHHRAHVASVLAERGAWEEDVVGVAFDGTGYGDDGTIWGGEFFTGSVRGGFERAGHLRPAALPGGDAAARRPEQAAAGFLYGLPGSEDGSRLGFSDVYRRARELVRGDVRTFRTSSVGRLFDAVAALCGFTREIGFEGQAAMWLEHVAAGHGAVAGYDFGFEDGVLDARPALARVIAERCDGASAARIARAFHEGLADAVAATAARLGPGRRVVVSGGVFQNRLLLELVRLRLGERLWANERVPPGDGGLCLGQAALAAFARRDAAAPSPSD